MPDKVFSTETLILSNKGLVARFAADRIPKGGYRNLRNLETRIEEALSSRYGRIPITVDPVTFMEHPLPGAIYTLARLRSLDDAAGSKQTFRYAAAGDKLYRRAGDGNGAYAEILDGLSGKRFSTINYRPDFSSFPYLYIADANRMVKDNGTTSSRWGIHAPAIPATMALQLPRNTFAETFDRVDHFTFTNPVA